jgi:ataxia telangiectasia mutated family protein
LSGNADAERAVLRVQQKLEGAESGESGIRSVEAQVFELLEEAQDPEHLAKMYPGELAFTLSGGLDT